MYPQYNRDIGEMFEEGLMVGLSWLLFWVVGILVVVAFRTIAEIVAVYIDRALKPSPVRKFLWIALAVYLGTFPVIFLLVWIVTPPLSVVILLPAWAFGFFTVAVVGADVYASQFDEQPEQLPVDPGIEDTLIPWQMEGPRGEAV